MCSVAREGKGAIACQRNAMHQALVAVIVIHGVVQRTAIVPKRNGTWLPTEATGVLGLDLMAEKIIQQPSTFFLGPTIKPGRMARIDIQGLSSGFGVGSNDGMTSGQLLA